MTDAGHREPPEANPAARIAAAFDAWHAAFRAITRRARVRFARREWSGAQADHAERLALHAQHAARLEAALRPAAEAWGPRWDAVRRDFAARCAGRPDAELAGSFFNSVTRRLLAIRGSDPLREFTAETAPASPPPKRRAARRCEAGALEPHRLVTLLGEAQLGGPWEDLDRDAVLAAAAVRAQLAQSGLPATWEVAEVLPAPFFRNKGAYVVARLRGAGGLLRPLVFAVVHEPGGLALDAVLTDPDEVSAVFGFTRSYFHVELEHPAAAVGFLAEILPGKRRDELWTALGYHKHGKTELFRTLERQLAEPGARFLHAEGDRGMVMAVFTLPSLNVVFKVIRDRFDPPKQSTAAEVRRRYELVFRHDRVGRLADAQEFEDLVVPRACMEPSLLDELRRECARTVRLEGDHVVLGHCYAERRVTPLNLFLKRAAPAEALGAVLDYGSAVRDLAAANIFPGDMLLKNFGVTRHGRVIFYDYDELCLLTECRVREVPQAAHWDDELSAEPWFAVGEGDIFPEEFRHFMVLGGDLGAAFLEAHGDLLTPAFWRAMQARQTAGEVVDFYPYPAGRRLPGRGVVGGVQPA